VKLAYISQGYNGKEVPLKMISGENLRICPRGFTCCTQEMEQKLYLKSEEEYKKLLSEKIGLLRRVFISRTTKFDDFFTALLDQSKRDLHDMFVRTYGLLYQQNSHVFTDLFHDLQNYYKGRDINLLDALDKFFSTLLQKMFELLNAQYTFDEAYLECVTEHMDELQPFGDVPQKLSVQIKRSFVAARTFVQGLAVGRDIILAVSQVEPTSSCNKAHMKMLYCPYCRGFADIKSCNNYCMNVMKGCLAYHSEINEPWNAYIDALMKLADRLEGPFNIESVVDPIDVKISDAIMNFQENSQTVSSKIFSGCGQPRLGRKKRSSDFGADYMNVNDNQKSYLRPTTAAGTSLDRLVRDIKQKVHTSKDFWVGLSHQVCNDQAAAPYDDANCWNGLGKSRYIPEVLNDGVVNQINNPEVEVDIRKPNSVVNQQILQLKLITNKLKSAYNGYDVDWMDTDFSSSDSSGSGSGQGDELGSGSGSYTVVDNNKNGVVISTIKPHSPKTRGPGGSNPEQPLSGGSSRGDVMTYSAVLVVLSGFITRYILI